MKLSDVIRKAREEAPKLTANYRHSIKQSGGLLTESMVFAYNRGINDAIKILTKELINEESVQKEQK